MAKEEKHNLQEALEEIRQRFGEGAIMKLKDTAKVNVDVISTGSISLDSILGIGGVPRGRVIEIFGAESTGKTTVALHICAEAQKKGGTAAFIDAENALDPDYAERIGVNINDLLISQPDSGEQALQIVEALVSSGDVDVIVIDSVAALTPKAEIAGEIGEFQIGLQARLMSAALRKLSSIIAKAKTVVIFLNQTRMKIGVMFGNPETTPGGKALKFYTSVRLDIRRIAQIKKGDETVGARTRVKVVKNKVASPFRETEFDIMFGEGISREGEMLALGEKFGIIQKAGAGSYAYGEEKLGRGYDAARTYLRENTKISSQLLKEIRKKFAEI